MVQKTRLLEVIIEYRTVQPPPFQRAHSLERVQPHSLGADVNLHLLTFTRRKTTGLTELSSFSVTTQLPSEKRRAKLSCCCCCCCYHHTYTSCCKRNPNKREEASESEFTKCFPHDHLGQEPRVFLLCSLQHNSMVVMSGDGIGKLKQ